MFKKILVSNRGEIALRVLTSLQDHDIRSVVTASDPDLNTAVTRRADEVIHLPGQQALKTYLNIELIIEKAVDLGVDAIHPGYGFLSENHLFAQAAEDAGIAFIGPSAKQMLTYGDKLRARAVAIKTGTPIIKGTDEELSIEEIKEKAKEIGFPLLIKASAGGGGRGIRYVSKIEELDEQIEMAKNEARLAFNDDRIYLEKFIANGRHIEVQIMGTGDGTIYHFGERDCTMQRKNQKLIEESPAPITRTKAKEMYESAINLTSETNYKNAGTVEFLYDPKTEEHYFLEVNARIQVEHPVTEMVTNEDLIWRQLQVAAGEDLDINQKRIRIKGHAIEARIYAENPYQNFIPSPGKISRIQHPIGAGVRVDSAIEDGSIVTPFYDSMISKLIVKAQTRDAAIRKMSSTLDKYLVSGVHTTIPYIRKLINSSNFKENKYHTKYLDTYETHIPKRIIELARVIAAFTSRGIHTGKEDKEEDQISKWRTSAWPKY